VVAPLQFKQDFDALGLAHGEKEFFGKRLAAHTAKAMSAAVNNRLAGGTSMLRRGGCDCPTQRQAPETLNRLGTSLKVQSSFGPSNLRLSVGHHGRA
jgi:hypothetical protein